MDVTKEGNKAEITMTVERLWAMEHWGKSLWWTPGSPLPYWSHANSWRDDVFLATPVDFAKAEGFDSLEGFDGDETLSITVDIP